MTLREGFEAEGGPRSAALDRLVDWLVDPPQTPRGTDSLLSSVSALGVEETARVDASVGARLENGLTCVFLS